LHRTTEKYNGLPKLSTFPKAPLYATVGKLTAPSDHSLGCSKTAKTAAPDGVDTTTGRLTTVNYGTEDHG
jgi:hypothetical protein